MLSNMLDYIYADVTLLLGLFRWVLTVVFQLSAAVWSYVFTWRFLYLKMFQDVLYDLEWTCVNLITYWRNN